MARQISFKEQDKNKELFLTLCAEIRVFALRSGKNPMTDSMSIATDYLYKMELSGRIPCCDTFIKKLSAMGFMCTSDVIDYVLAKSNIIGWQ